jgi:putative transposase
MENRFSGPTRGVKPLALGEAFRRFAVLWSGDEVSGHGSHTVYARQYHFVFIPKYRKPVPSGRSRDTPTGPDTRDLQDAGHRDRAAAHSPRIMFTLLLSVPPTLSPTRVMNAIKGKSATRLMRDFRSLNRTFWGRHLWARGYFVATSGNIADQDVEPQHVDFKVTE